MAIGYFDALVETAEHFALLFGGEIFHCHQGNVVIGDANPLCVSEETNLVVHNAADGGDAVAAFHNEELAVFGTANDGRNVVALQDTVEEVDLHFVAPYVGAIAAVDVDWLGLIVVGHIGATGELIVDVVDGAVLGAGFNGGHCFGFWFSV